MHLKYGLSTALIGTSIALVQFQVQSANALTAPEVAKIAKQITVRIESQVEGRKKQGSGFIIKKSDNTYYVITAHHVVSDEAKYSLIAPDGERYNLDSQKINYKSGIDLAVVEFTSDKTYKVAKTGNSDNATEGTTVYVAGFPASTSTVTSSELYRFLEGKISANASQPLAEGYSLVYTNPTLGGMSGGPVLNERGEAIAVHGKAETQAQSSGEGVKVASTGNNLGISLNTFLRLALLETGTKAPSLPAAEAPKADDFYLKGVDLERKKDYRGAIAAYERALQINPKYAKAHFGKGFARIELKEYKQGIADYTEAIALDPSPLAYHNRGVGHTNLKDYRRAIADYSRAIELDPKYAQAYNSRAYIRVELKEYQQGIADYDRAIALDSKNANSYHGRGYAKVELRQYREGIADYNQAIAIDPKYASAYHNRGIAYLNLKDYPQALSNYTQAIAIDPKYAQAYYSRGYVFVELKDYRQGIADYTQAIALNPQYASAYDNRAYAHQQSKNYSEAIADYTKAIALDPKFTQIYYSRANARFELKDYDKAIADYDKAIAVNPKNANAYNNRGNARKELKEYRQAIADYDKAIAIDPNLANAFNNRGLARYEIQEVDAAIADWRKAISFYQKWAAPQLALAVALYRQNNKADAFKLGGEAISLDAQLRDLQFLKVNWLWGSSLLQDTEKLFKEPRFQK